jgi:hypothetical protein
MKKLFILICTVSMLSLFGCGEKKEAVVTVEENEEASKNFQVYEQWKMQYDEESHLDFVDYEQKDCVGLYNGINHNGDLLSSLIVDEHIRGRADLDVYSPAYIASLEKKIADKAGADFDSEFYAFHVCHLDDGVDVAAGYLWLRGEDDYHTSFSRTDFFKGSLALVQEENVKIYENFSVLNKTATGAEVSACSASKKFSKISWKCFDSFSYDGDSLSPIYLEWEFDNLGGIAGFSKYTE